MGRFDNRVQILLSNVCIGPKRWCSGVIFMYVYAVWVSEAQTCTVVLLLLLFWRLFDRILIFLNKMGSGPIQSFPLFFYVFYCSQKNYFVDADKEVYFLYRDFWYSALVVRWRVWCHQINLFYCYYIYSLYPALPFHGTQWNNQFYRRIRRITVIPSRVFCECQKVLACWHSNTNSPVFSLTFWSKV